MDARHSRAAGARIFVVLGVLLLVAVITLVIVWLVRPDSTDGGPGSQAALTHVHGLGLNPADGSLVIATHMGSFRIDDAGLARLGDSEQDTMGLTVLGPDHFLGSGHPDRAGMDAGAPSRLGVIESRDAGATWEELALGGEADLHAITVSDEMIYGWDASSGRLMASADGRTWGHPLHRRAHVACRRSNRPRTVAGGDAGGHPSLERRRPHLVGRRCAEPRRAQLGIP